MERHVTTESSVLQSNIWTAPKSVVDPLHLRVYGQHAERRDVRMDNDVRIF